MKKCMIGERYGSLVVIEKVKIPGKLKTYWRCRCDCGNTCTLEDSHLKNGHTKSCGCRRRKNASIPPDSGTAGLSFWDRQRERQKKCDGAVEQSGSSEGDRADRPVIAEYTEEKTTDGEHPLAFRESPTILAASQPMRRQFRRGWTRKSGYMIHF